MLYGIQVVATHYEKFLSMIVGLL